jgi:S-adenosylmethionine-diacylglycerol 3-amino-3-carboxypropyl transferase
LGRKTVQSGNDATVEASVDFSKIRYSQVWEDTRLLRQGLCLKPQSRVLSIASAGDNAFALLLDDAREVVAIGEWGSNSQAN